MVERPLRRLSEGARWDDNAFEAKVMCWEEGEGRRRMVRKVLF
jgi:hypothetical protein